MDAAPAFDLHQFAARKSLPVEAHLTADGIESTSLSFADYASMQTYSRASFSGRSKKTPPAWAMNLRQLGEMLARFFERRAGILCPRIDLPERRVIHAVSKLLAAIPAKVAILDRMSAEYVAAKNDGDEARARVLEQQIKTLDGVLCIDKHGPSLVVGIVHYYFRCGYDSVATSAALNHVVSPVGIRQTASRLSQLWERMQNGTDKKPTPDELRRASRRAWWELSGYKNKQATREKAERAAETPAERDARLRYHREYYYTYRDRIAAQQKANWKKRDYALRVYHSLTPEQIEERKQKARIYGAAHREKLNADARRRAAARAAKMTPAERDIKRAQSRAYAAAHRGRIREVHALHRARKKAAEATVAKLGVGPEFSFR